MSERVEVELVYLDDCPHSRAAVARVGEAMRIAGLDPTSVRYRSVATAHASPDFPGSPTILIDGRDPFPNASPVGPTCRRYPTAQGPDVAPSVDQLVESLSR